MKKEYVLKYGDSAITLRIPEKNVLHFIEVPEPTTQDDNQTILRRAIQQPLEAPALSTFVHRKRVALLLEDATRDVPYEDILLVLTPSLVTAQQVEVFICTGTHNPTLPGNQQIAARVRRIFLAKGIADFDIIIHDSRTPPFVSYGQTRFGNELLVNPRLQNAEVFVVLSDMKNHYFAGYSNLVKNFLPGVCAFQVAERNHRMALLDEATFGHHPWHPDENRRGNPLAEEMVEGFEKITAGRPVWALATITKNHHILWARAGHPRKITEEGILKVDEWMSRKVEPADVLIVSPGGYPNDESLYTAQRALELNKNAVKRGGKILFLAECRNGIGPESALENFYQPLTQDIPQVLKLIEQQYIMYSHKAYKFARMIQKLSFLGIKTALDGEVVERIHLSLVSDPQEVIDRWLKENPDLKINLVNDGNKIALHRSDGTAF